MCSTFGARATATSDRALPLAAHDLERLPATPVDEQVERLEAELDRDREVPGRLLERCLPHPVGECVEPLAVAPLALVEADPALHRIGHPLGRQAHLEPLAVRPPAAVVAASDVGDVGRQLPVADLDRGAVEADRPDVVLAAAIGAARHLDVDLPGQRVGDPHGLDPLLDRPVQPHGARDAELARVGARAAHDVADLVGAGAGESKPSEAEPEVVERLVADPAEDHVLLDRGTRVAAGELAHQVGEAAELLRAEIPPGHLDLDGREALLALGPDARLQEAVELGPVAVGAPKAGLRRRGVRLLVVEEQAGRGVEIAVAEPVPLELLVDHAPELIDPNLVNQELEPSPGAVLAKPVLAVEDPQHRLGDLEVVAAVELDEVVERRPEAGHDRGPAAGSDLDALDSVTHAGEEAEVVDEGDRAVGVAGCERHLELARHRLADLVAHEVADEGGGVRGDVERLVVADAGERVAGDVADGVAARLARRESRPTDLVQDLGRILGRYVVELDVLARRDVALAERRVALGDVREGLELLRGDAAEGKLDPDHLDGGLALPVDPLPEAEGDVLLRGRAPLEEGIGLRVEVLELALEDGDHVARDVLVDLGILERALPTAPAP